MAFHVFRRFVLDHSDNTLPGHFTALMRASVANDCDAVRSLLQCEKKEANTMGCAPGGVDHFTPLYMAIRCNCEDAAMELMADRVVDVNLPSSTNRVTPLGLACCTGSMRLLRHMVLDLRVNVNQPICAGRGNPLTFACRHGFGGIVQLLLTRPDIIVRCDMPRPPLFYACHGGYTAIVNALMAHTGHLDETAKGALFEACYMGHVDAVSAFVSRHGWGINRSYNGETLITVACRRGMFAVVDMLLAHTDIDVNKKTSVAGRACTALGLACCHGDVRVVARMLRHAAVDVNASDGDGMTPLCIACVRGWGPVVRMLLNSPGISVNASSNSGVTPLMIACEQAHCSILNQLLDHPDINAVRSTAGAGLAAIHFACCTGGFEKKNIDVIMALLQSGKIDINQLTDEQDETPLHGLVRAGDCNAVQRLVTYGADRTRQDCDGFVPAELQGGTLAAAECAAWLTKCASWSPLRVVAACGLYRDAAFMLRRGLLATEVSDAAAAIAEAQNASPVCMRTLSMVRAAAGGWKRTSHWLHHAGVRTSVMTMICTHYRLAQTNKDVLPVELWFVIMGFFLRSWWSVRPR